MTGLGEEVYTATGGADVDEMVEAAARGVCCTRPDGSDDGVWPCPLCKRMNTPPMERPCAAQARAALESLGVDLAVLAALRAGEWQAVPKVPTIRMQAQLTHYWAPEIKWERALEFSPKTPEATR